MPRKEMVRVPRVWEKVPGSGVWWITCQFEMRASERVPEGRLRQLPICRSPSPQEWAV